MTAIDDLLPLSPAVFHILLALADQDRHGYGIMQDVEERTGATVRLGPGMLYGSIKWLLADGLIADGRRPAGERDDPRRRYYRLTGFGREVLKAEAARLEAAVRLARSRRILEGKA